MSKAIKASTGPAPVNQKGPRRVVTSARLEAGRLELSATQEQEDELRHILGSESPDFQSYLIEHTLRAMALLKEDGDLTGGINTGLAIINAVAPTNELEAILAVQMVGSNHFAMKSWARAANNSDLAVVQANAAMANKASRTFAMQMEVLAKMRRGGEQVVRHVHVNDGGQAVIAGTVHTGGGGGKVKESNDPKEPEYLRTAPRCLAKTRTKTECQSPAMPNGRCRLHGGKSPGARPGNRNAWKHGLRSAEFKAMRDALRGFVRDLDGLC